MATDYYYASSYRDRVSNPNNLAPGKIINGLSTLTIEELTVWYYIPNAVSRPKYLDIYVRPDNIVHEPGNPRSNWVGRILVQRIYGSNVWYYGTVRRTLPYVTGHIEYYAYPTNNDTAYWYLNDSMGFPWYNKLNLRTSVPGGGVHIQEIPTPPFIRYDVLSAYDDKFTCRTFVGADDKWGVYLNISWAANTLYDSTTDDWYIPDNNNEIGFKNTLTAKVLIYDNEDNLVYNSGNIDISARYEASDFRDLLATTGDGDPPDIATAGGIDTLLATLVPGRRAYYINKCIYTHEGLYDIHNDDYYVVVDVWDATSLTKQDLHHIGPLIYYGDSIFSFGKTTNSQSEVISSVESNLPISIDTDSTTPLTINGKSLKQYIYDIKHPTE